MLCLCRLAVCSKNLAERLLPLGYCTHSSQKRRRRRQVRCGEMYLSPSLSCGLFFAIRFACLMRCSLVLHPFLCCICHAENQEDSVQAFLRLLLPFLAEVWGSSSVVLIVWRGLPRAAVLVDDVQVSLCFEISSARSPTNHIQSMTRQAGTTSAKSFDVAVKVEMHHTSPSAYFPHGLTDGAWLSDGISCPQSWRAAVFSSPMSRQRCSSRGWWLMPRGIVMVCGMSGWSTGCFGESGPYFTCGWGACRAELWFDGLLAVVVVVLWVHVAGGAVREEMRHLPEPCGLVDRPIRPHAPEETGWPLSSHRGSHLCKVRLDKWCQIVRRRCTFAVASVVEQGFIVMSPCSDVLPSTRHQLYLTWLCVLYLFFLIFASPLSFSFTLEDAGG